MRLGCVANNTCDVLYESTDNTIFITENNASTIAGRQIRAGVSGLMTCIIGVYCRRHTVTEPCSFDMHIGLDSTSRNLDRRISSSFCGIRRIE